MMSPLSLPNDPPAFPIAPLRIIPRLDIKGSNVVKGVHLEGLRVVGRPETMAQAYYEAGADELLYMDVVASLYGRNSLLEIVERTSRSIFVPLTAGGGLRSIDDIRAILKAGADKVALNTAALGRPDFVREAAEVFGSSTIVVSIEAIRRADGVYEAYTDNGREKTGRDAIEWARQAAELGAGEIMVTSIDREGTGAGLDLDLIGKISEAVSVPVIASGGAGRSEHVSQAASAGAQAVCVASMLHYHHARRHAEAHDRAMSGFGRIEERTLGELKGELSGFGVACRPVEAAHV
jgi:imidazole glycerol-phosphate synthase subunit HisF